MSDNLDHLRSKLLDAVMTEPGPLALTRDLLRLRNACPELDLDSALARLLEDHPDPDYDPVVRLQEVKVKVVTLLDPGYPRFLKSISDPPVALFYAGKLAVMQRPAVALVGSRKCGDYGRQITKQLAGELARLGFVVVSGLAAGIDAAAHGAALEVGGLTLAVLGSGPDIVYPRHHRDLAAGIVHQDGCVLSEFPPGTPPRAFHFPVRNRIISGLCHAVIVVEAQQRSGSLITAHHCLDQGRQLFAVPGPINQTGSRGTNTLIASGEAAALTSITQVLEDLSGLLGMAAGHRSQLFTRIKDPLARRIYDRLDAFEPVGIDELASETRIATGLLVAKLTELESSNLIERRPGFYYLRNPLSAAS